jgi:hypothetical protein
MAGTSFLAFYFYFYAIRNPFPARFVCWNAESKSHVCAHGTRPSAPGRPQSGPREDQSCGVVLAPSHRRTQWVLEVHERRAGQCTVRSTTTIFPWLSLLCLQDQRATRTACRNQVSRCVRPHCRLRFGTPYPRKGRHVARNPLSPKHRRGALRVDVSSACRHTATRKNWISAPASCPLPGLSLSQTLFRFRPLPLSLVETFAANYA